MRKQDEQMPTADEGPVERGVGRLLDEAKNICMPPLALPETRMP